MMVPWLVEEALKVAVPVMVPRLIDVVLKVTLPVILVVLVVVPEKMTPDVRAEPVREVESIESGRVPTVEIIGDTEPVRMA